ncbi:MAG TPA: aminoglycoside phosphotransferase family protein [Mycobacteriales bacterium]|nr:aminoglycoside phosphotransferase family protein [Mycobacteriales bacterium]
MEIDVALVRALLAEQFPRWAGLPVRPVERSGWDNRTFRLGDALSVRLPSAAGYVPAVEKEQRWLPYLGARLAVPIPVPVGRGGPGAGYPYPWSVYRWIEGTPIDTQPPADLVGFATELGEFLNALRGIDATGGPAAGPHSFWRGGSLTVYDQETREAITRLGGEPARARAREIWADGLAATWHGPPVWFHGDVAEGNLLTRDGRLAAVIDFGTCGVGDPSSDLRIAWTLFAGRSRGAFREVVDQDEATWARARAWTLWKALITADDPGSRRILDELLQR